MSNKQHNTPLPPRLADTLFEWYCNEMLIEELQGDLHERFKQNIEINGTLRAKIQYWIDVFRFINKYTLRRNRMEEKSFFNNAIMIKNYIKVAIRHMIRNKSYAAINIIGFSIGLASCIIIFFYVNQELSHDTFHVKSDRIYRATNTVVRSSQTIFWGTTPPALAPALSTDFAGIEKATRLRSSDDHYFSVEDNRFYERSLFFADSAFFEIFDFVLLAGNPKTALNNPNSIVITEDLALKYFGERLPIGKLIVMDNETNLKVTGILAPLPENSHINFDVLISFNTYKTPPGYLADLNSWAWMGFNTYVLLNKNQDPRLLEKEITEVYWANEKRLINLDLQANLQPLSDVYLGSYHLDNDDAISYKFGSKNSLYTLSIVAILILLIAGFNFMTMSTAMSLSRGKEVGIRKVLGAIKIRLITQFLTESIVVGIISLTVAFLMIFLVRQPINNLLQAIIIPDIFNLAEYLPIILLTTVLIGIFSGMYPALVLSAFNPIMALKNSLKMSFSGNVTGKILITAQFLISIGLITSTLIGTRQMDFIRNKSLGFDKENVVILQIPREDMAKNYELILAKLKQNANVQEISISSHIPDGSIGSSPLRLKSESETTSFQTSYFQVDYDYLKTMNIPLLKGRFFSRDFNRDSTEALILNESAIALLGLSDPIGKKVIFPSNTERTIIGVVKDFHFSSLHHAIEPMAMVIPFTIPSYVNVRLSSGNIQEKIASIQTIWDTSFAEIPLNFFFLDNRLNNMYLKEQNLSKLISGFTFLAVMLACLGLYGLVAFSIKNKLKEVGIRKVLGASIEKILILLSKQYLYLIATAILISVPLTWYITNMWLENFAYRIDIDWWLFLVSGISLILIAGLTVSIQTIKAAKENPVKVLRNE